MFHVSNISHAKAPACAGTADRRRHEYVAGDLQMWIEDEDEDRAAEDENDQVSGSGCA